MTDKISELKTLFTRLVDSYEGYKDAAENASQERHIRMFTDLSKERLENVLLLQDYLKRYDVELDIEDSILASTHRFFMELKNKFDDGDDEALMEAIITGESELMSNYRDAIEDATYDVELLNALQKQYQRVEANLSIIDAKEKAA